MTPKEKRPSSKRSLEDFEIAECRAAKEIFDRKKKDLGLTQLSLGDLLGMTQTAVNNYLNGVNAINLEFAIPFAVHVGCRIRDFSPRLADKIDMVRPEIDYDKFGELAKKMNASNLDSQDVRELCRQVDIIQMRKSGSL